LVLAIVFLSCPTISEFPDWEKLDRGASTGMIFIYLSIMSLGIWLDLNDVFALTGNRAGYFSDF
jgi:hypothetical protein